MIAKNLAPEGDVNNSTYESYFLATKGQSVILSNLQTRVEEI